MSQETLGVPRYQLTEPEGVTQGHAAVFLAAVKIPRSKAKVRDAGPCIPRGGRNSRWIPL